MSTIRNAAYLSSISLYANQIVELAFAMFISRAFTPDQIGVFAIAVGVTMISGEIRLLGVGDYLIRTKNIDEEKVRSSLGLTILISWSIGLLLIATAAPVASFYNNQDLNLLLIILSTGFFFSPFISVNSSLLNKELKFGHSIIIDWIGLLVNIFVTIILYYNGFDYFSLAIGSATGVMSKLIAAIFLKSKAMNWHPKFSNFGEQLKFGSIASTCGLLEKAQVMSFDLILGRIGNTREVAIMSKALGGAQIISHTLVSGVKKVALPYLSQVERGELTDSFIKATLLVTVICLPVLISMTAIGPQLVYVLFGDQWTESGQLLTIISIWCFFKHISPFTKSFLFVIQKEKVFLLLQTVNLILTITAIVLGYNFSLQGVAYAIAIVGFLDCIITIWVLSYYLGRPPRVLIASFHTTSAVTFICGICSWITLSIIESFFNSAYYQLFIFAVFMILIWLAAIRLTNHSALEELIKLPVFGKALTRVFFLK